MAIQQIKNNNNEGAEMLPHKSNKMKEYKELYEKFQNKTITKKEQERLFILAFGGAFMNDKNPNKKWKA